MGLYGACIIIVIIITILHSIVNDALYTNSDWQDRDRVTNGGSRSGKGYISAIPIHKKGAHQCIYDTLILLYLVMRILTTF